jgi:hypothetical protein
MPLFQFISGELKTGAFQTGPILIFRKMNVPTSLEGVGVWLMDSSNVVKFKVHFLVLLPFFSIG